MREPAVVPAAKQKSPADQFREKTDEAKAEAEYNQTREDIRNPPGVREMQAQQLADLLAGKNAAEERAREAEKTAREADQEARKEAEAAAAKARDDAQAARDALHDQQMRMLSDKLDESIASRQGFQAQFDEYFGFAEKMATQMGYQRPGLTQPASENPQIALEVVKLQIQNEQHQRDHERQMAQDKREWDIKLEEMRQNQNFQQQQINLDQQKAGMLAQLPEAIGGALLRGAVERGPRPVSQRTQTPAPATEKKAYKIQVGVGEANEIECPNCQTGVAFGPTSVTARCVGCNEQFPIERIGEPEVK